MLMALKKGEDELGNNGVKTLIIGVECMVLLIGTHCP